MVNNINVVHRCTLYNVQCAVYSVQCQSCTLYSDNLNHGAHSIAIGIGNIVTISNIYATETI